MIMHSSLEEPAPLASSQHFAKWLSHGEIRLPFDRDTGAVVQLVDVDAIEPSRLEWRIAAPRGTIVAMAVYRRQYHPDFTPPYAVAIVSLDDGPFLVAKLEGPVGDYSMGMAVFARIERGTLRFMHSGLRGGPAPCTNKI